MKTWSKSLVVILTGALLFMVVMILSEKQININLDGKLTKLNTRNFFVSQVLSEAGIEINSQDFMNSDKWALALNGSTIEVKKAVPINIKVDGKEVLFMDYKLESSHLLARAGVELSSSDEIIGELSKEKVPVNLEVIRVEYETFYEESEIPYSTVRNLDPLIKKGTVEIKQQGEKGLIGKTYRIRYENGQQTIKTLVEEKILKYPQNHLINFGVKDSVIIASRSSFNTRKMLVMETTAYTHTGNTTYTGVWPKVGTIAVDPKVIPLGTKLWVEGYGFGVAQDTGGLIKGNIIDLFMETEKECLHWGRRYVKVYIIE